MEFANLGKHCAEPSCKQLDFLPFSCSACNRIFCLDHRSFAAHKCPNVTDTYVPECPMCGQIIPVTKGEDPNVKVDQHIAQGCPKIASKPSQSYACSLPKCSKTEVMPVTCPSCRKNFCLKHRMPQDHQCIIEERKKERKEKMSSSSAAKQGKYESAVKSATAKTHPTALKVAMMKMKMHALGDDRIPQERRFYLEVVYPVDSGVNPKMMFFDQNYSIGKVLDLVADAGGIENNNNKVNSEKLHLILLKSGTPLPNDATLGKVDNLSSGDSILLGTLDALVQS